MYAKGEGLGTHAGKSQSDEGWQNWETVNKSINGKQFIRCICPRCRKTFNAYLMWTGRGIPRKYCTDCKVAINNYDDSAIYETTSAVEVPARKRGRGATEE